MNEAKRTEKAEKLARAFSSFTVGLLLGAIFAWGADYAFYWLFGDWLPWLPLLYLFIVGALDSYAYSATPTKPRSLIAIVIPAVWALLWLAHFAPRVSWPLLGAR
jgi:hypothetical protein